MRITEHKTTGVTLGVLDKGIELMEDLVSVTFYDYNNTPHTVFAHRDGPFKTPEDIVSAWYQHTLHTNPAEHDDATPEHTPTEGQVN